jgi:predicted 2-oxoglutarate/Fe(II)-dependent dioxygenase YbiX
MKLIDFINVYDNIITSFVCDLILKEYQNSNEWNYNNDIQSIFLTDENTIKNNLLHRSEIDKLIQCSIFRINSELMKKYNFDWRMYPKSDSGYTLIKQGNNNFYRTNFFNSKYFCFISLNDDYCGGEYSFFDGEIKINLKKGSAIIFPSNFLYNYKILPVTFGFNHFIFTSLL